MVRFFFFSEFVRLTAFVMKSFAQAVQLNLIMIDSNVMDSGVNYIINNQNVKGNFKNTGVVFHRRLQVIINFLIVLLYLKYEITTQRFKRFYLRQFTVQL